MSELLASTSYHGFDIDLSQVSPVEWLPDNFSFSKLDLNEDEICHDLEGTFDVINIRHLLLVVKADDPTPVFRKILRMLKPGGWLQWTESDNVTGQGGFLKAKPHLSDSAMTALRDTVVSESLGPKPTWPLRLAEFFRDNGFEHVQEDRKAGNDYLPWLAFTSDVITTIYQERIHKQQQGSERDELQRIYNQAAEDSLVGTAWNGPRITVVGQKPKFV